MENTIVMSRPPIKPSTVFLGESFGIRGVLPYMKPKMYAKTSLVTTREDGRTDCQGRKDGSRRANEPFSDAFLISPNSSELLILTPPNDALKDHVEHD